MARKRLLEKLKIVKHSLRNDLVWFFVPWLISMLVFFAIGIPFFFVFYLGLKILVNNLKSIGNITIKHITI